jgi:hypothetical protein
MSLIPPNELVAYKHNGEQARQEAIAQGHTIVEPVPNLLLIDLDDGARLDKDVLKTLQKEYGAFILSSWASRSGNGTHVVIQLNIPLSPVERVGLQACLGSDPVREFWALHYLIKHGLFVQFLIRPAATGRQA